MAKSQKSIAISKLNINSVTIKLWFKNLDKTKKRMVESKDEKLKYV